MPATSMEVTLQNRCFDVKMLNVKVCPLIAYAKSIVLKRLSLT